MWSDEDDDVYWSLTSRYLTRHMYVYLCRAAICGTRPLSLSSCDLTNQHANTLVVSGSPISPFSTPHGGFFLGSVIYFSPTTASLCFQFLLFFPSLWWWWSQCSLVFFSYVSSASVCFCVKMVHDDSGFCLFFISLLDSGAMILCLPPPPPFPPLLFSSLEEPGLHWLLCI